MKKGKIIYYSIPILVVICLSGIIPVLMGPYPPLKPHPIPIGDYTYAIEFAEYSINKMMKKYDLPSVAISIVDDQETVWSTVRGISNEENNQPATSETVYRLGSISKAFTAIEIMRLVDEGLVDLDAPISDYLSDFCVKNHQNDPTPITIRHILAHRSGLPRNGNLLSWYWDPGFNNVLRELVNSVNNTYTAYPAGFRYKYSNFAFNLLGRIIEVIRGEQFAVVLENELFNPLGMNSTAFHSHLLNPSSQFAVGYYHDGKVNVPYSQYDFIKMCSGNLYSTVGDMSTFMKWIFRNGEHEGESLLLEENLLQMYEDQYSKPGDPQTNGLGFFTHQTADGELIVYHDGDIEGIISSMFVLPERKLGVFMTSNSDRFSEAYQFFMIELLEILLETKYGILPSKNELQTISVDSSILEQYAGKYTVDTDQANIYMKNGKLKASIMGYTANLLPITESRFQFHHWLIDASIFEVEFFEDYMILSIAGIDFKFCPKYPVYETIPENWSLFVGEYDTYARTDSIYTAEWGVVRNEIQISNGMLQFRSGYFHLISISETELIILGGPHDGEIMTRDPGTGYIYWSHLIYKPVQ